MAFCTFYLTHEGLLVWSIQCMGSQKESKKKRFKIILPIPLREQPGTVAAGDSAYCSVKGKAAEEQTPGSRSQRAAVTRPGKGSLPLLPASNSSECGKPQALLCREPLQFALLPEESWQLSVSNIRHEHVFLILHFFPKNWNQMRNFLLTHPSDRPGSSYKPSVPGDKHMT